MAKLKNLFIGCPVTVKGGDSEVGIVASIDTEEGSAWISFPNDADSDDGWKDFNDLKLAQFAEPEKVANHLEKFL